MQMWSEEMDVMQRSDHTFMQSKWISKKDQGLIKLHSEQSKWGNEVEDMYTSRCNNSGVRC